MGKICNLLIKSSHYMLNLIYMQTPIDVEWSACLDLQQH